MANAVQNFFKGLKTDQQAPQSSISINEKNIFEFTILRWGMKKLGVSVDIKRSEAVASSLISLRLVKSGAPGSEDEIFDTGVTDSRIEKGLFELERKLLEISGLTIPVELEIVLQLLRNNTLALPPHNDLRNELIMNKNSIRLGYIGENDEIGEDVFGGALYSKDGKVLASTPPQSTLGRILDNLENALYAKERDSYRKAIGVRMLEIRSNLK